MGEVPEGWIVRRLGDFVEILDNLRVPISSSIRQGRIGQYPYCGANGIQGYIDDYIIDDDVVLLAEDGGNFESFTTRPIAYRMTGKIWVNNHAHILKGAKGICETGYLFFCMQHKDITSHISSGTRSKLTRAEMIKICVAMPSTLSEQKSITEVLDNFNEGISTLERLIVKKEAVKQGMMQQLLTGKTRLPGFTDPWVNVRLGDVAKIKTGKSNNEEKDAMGAYPFFVRSEKIERINRYSYDCEAILVPGEGNIGSIFHYVNGRFEVHQRVYKISDFNVSVVAKYIYNHMRQFFGAHAMENSVKATVDSLRLPTFTDFALRLPASQEEQRAISAYLDDSDTEIQVLRRRLDKAKAIKQGMMQELLTGRTRLPVGPQVATAVSEPPISPDSSTPRALEESR